MQVGRTWIVFSMTLVLLTACTDKAQPSYAACILADTSGDTAGALPMASTLFNRGLIAHGMGETEQARACSLGLREQPAVRAVLNSLPSPGGQ